MIPQPLRAGRGRRLDLLERLLASNVRVENVGRVVLGSLRRAAFRVDERGEGLEDQQGATIALPPRLRRLTVGELLAKRIDGVVDEPVEAAFEPWIADARALRASRMIAETSRSLFVNPSLRGPPAAAPVAARAPSVASNADPLPPAADAYRGIHLACLAGDLPPSTRTDAASIIHVGHYTLHPAVRVHEDGSKSLLYWTAVKPNEWQRLSMKAVDDAMRHGAAAAASTLSKAWSAAVRDPGWWGQDLLAVTGALAGSGAATRAEVAASEEGAAANAARRAPPTPGAHTPVVEDGGLQAHEGGAARAHLVERHVGKTTAELQERLAGSRRMQGCSSFYDRAQAEAAVSKTLAANEAKIAEWLKTGQ